MNNKDLEVRGTWHLSALELFYLSARPLNCESKSVRFLCPTLGDNLCFLDSWNKAQTQAGEFEALVGEESGINLPE